MSPRLISVNLLLLGVVAYFAYDLMGEVSAPRPLPARPVVRAPQAPAAGAPATAAATRPDQRGQFGGIASKNLFSPSRTDAVATGGEASGQPAAPRPILHGVVLDDAKSRAYLEDPTTKRVFGYAIGDSVGGGKLETIRADRVGIARPEGLVEVLLRDPSKPPPVTVGAQPPAPGQPAPARSPFPAIRPGIAGSSTPATPGVAMPTPLPTPEAQPTTAPPRPLQSLPSDFLRRPTVPPPDATPR